MLLNKKTVNFSFCFSLLEDVMKDMKIIILLRSQEQQREGQGSHLITNHGLHRGVLVLQRGGGGGGVVGEKVIIIMIPRKTLRHLFYVFS